MFVFKKGRIIIILICIVFSVISYLISNNRDNSIQVSANNVADKVIVLDAGHGRFGQWCCK